MNQPPFRRRPQQRFGPPAPPGQKAQLNPVRPRQPVAPANPDKTDWGDVADWYDSLVGDQGSEYHRHVVLPGVIRLLEPKPGQALLDVACGQGVLCRMLQGLGAQPTGVDAAGPLIEHARQRTGPGVRYLVADARELADHPELLAQSFDGCTCVLAIQNINPLTNVFRAVAKVLKPGARFVIAMMHPAFRVPKQSHWGWDERQGVQYRRVDKYLLPSKERIVTHPGMDQETSTWAFHRPLQTYVEALRNEGFWLDAVEEWPSHKVSDSGPRAQAENVAREEIPLFMALRAVRK